MATEHFVNGYTRFKQLIEVLEKNIENVYIFFCGAHDPHSKISWCPDCEKAEPIVMKVVKQLKEHTHFVHVSVGEVPEWKSPNCPFRTDKMLQLTSIPTLLEWKGDLRFERLEDFTQEKLEDAMLNK